MELKYPLVIYIGLPILILLIIVKVKKPIKYEKGKKIANTKYVEEIPYYKEVMKKYKILVYSIKGICIVAILMSLLLLARPATVDTTDSSLYSRDIFLCMDTSQSVDELNLQLIENFKKTVKDLKGERFGISIFNTSSVMLVPLTDDYEYVIEVLNKIQKGINESYNKDYSYDDSMKHTYDLNYIISGTLVGADKRGSSLIGDGLASCIYNFSNLEEERTRIIILSTDNAVEGTELINLQDASKIAKKKNITVFGVGPDSTTDRNREDFEKAVKKTGGKFYSADRSTTVTQIVNDIEKTGKNLVAGQKEVRKIDKPIIPFIILVISLMVLFILNKKVKL